MKEIRQEAKHALKGKSFLLFFYNVFYSLPMILASFFLLLLVMISFGEEPAAAFLAMIIIGILLTVLSVAVVSSQFYTATYIANHEELPLISEALQKGFQNFWKKCIVFLFINVLYGIGINLFVIPGILVLLTLFPAMYMLIDEEFEDYGPFEIIKESLKLTKGHYFDIFKLMAWQFFITTGVSLLMWALCLTAIGILFIPFIFTKLGYYLMITNYKLYEILKNEYYEYDYEDEQ